MKPSEIGEFIQSENQLRNDTVKQADNPVQTAINFVHARLARLEAAWMTEHQRFLPKLTYNDSGQLTVTVDGDDLRNDT